MNNLIDVLDKAKAQIGSRRGNYGSARRENSFTHIARRLQVWLKNNFDIDVEIQDWHVADMWVEFKRGRREARAAAGVSPVEDDAVDEAAYMQWRDWLMQKEQHEMPFEDADTVDFGEEGRDI